MPHPPRNSSTAAAATAAFVQPAVARTSVRRTVLFVAVHVVRNLIVDGHVIELRVGKALLEPRATARLRDRHALVVSHHHPVAVVGIDPHVVMVAAGCLLT